MSTRLQEQIELITDTLEKSPESGASCLLQPMSPAEISHVIESLPRNLRNPLWLQLPRLKKGEVLLEL
ncbi:MAG: magnesium transporter, partial [Candidatus Azotimanducaceae bacterium]